MDKIIEWIKANAREGANVEEALDLMKEADPLANITDADKAIRFMNQTAPFKSALDAEIRRAVESRDKRFNEEKLPEIRKSLREELAKEFAPKEETPEQKRIRELEEAVRERDERDRLEARKAALRKKASEIGFDPLRAERYAVFGEDAESVLLDDHETFSKTLNAELEKRSKGRFNTEDPTGPRGNPEAKTIKRSDFNQLSPDEQHTMMKDARAGKVNLVDG